MRGRRIQPRAPGRRRHVLDRLTLDQANRAAAIVRLHVQGVEPIVVVMDRSNLVAPAPMHELRAHEDDDDGRDSGNDVVHRRIQSDAAPASEPLRAELEVGTHRIGDRSDAWVRLVAR